MLKQTPRSSRLDRGHVTRPRKSSRTRHADLGDALGASHVFSVSARPHGPFGVAALLDEVKNRLISKGGRPSDPSPTVRRLVPLKTRVWKKLQTQAGHLSRLGKPVSPGQLAALLLERTIDEIETLEPQNPRA